jgi:hypothetical protein
MALIASPEYVSSGGPDGIPSVTGGKSAITFTHRPPRASSPTASSVSRSCGAASGSNAGKYRPAGARNRPAACNRGIPGTRSSCNTDPPADPASRTRHTPQAAHAASTFSASDPSRATGIPASRPTAGWAWASTKPGTTYRPGSRSAPGTGSVTRHPAGSTHRSTGRSPSGNCTAHTAHDIQALSLPPAVCAGCQIMLANTNR